MHDSLIQEGNSYFISSKKSFCPIDALSSQDINTCFDFAYGMTFGASGQHRDHRSGGRHTRKHGEVFINTFQGKVSEYALFRFLASKGFSTPSPDISKYNLGKWDSYDLIVNTRKINIKSTKHFGNLLLLETKDWNHNAQYIPNLASGEVAEYDYFILLRLKPDGEQIMKANRLLYADSADAGILRKAIVSQTWEYDIAGWVPRSSIASMISKRLILPQKALLNGRTEMDAENFYIQAGDMGNIQELMEKLKT